MEGEEEAQTVQGRQGNVTFRPYRDIKTKPLLKRKFAELDNDVDEDGGKEVVEGATMAEDLYPELLCHIFSMLDTVSKGRVAQVNIYFKHSSASEREMNRLYLRFASVGGTS